MPHSEFLRSTTCLSSKGIFVCDSCSLTVEEALEIKIPGIGMRAGGEHVSASAHSQVPGDQGRAWRIVISTKSPGNTMLLSKDHTLRTGTLDRKRESQNQFPFE